MRGLVAFPTVSKGETQGRFHAFAQERVTLSNTLCSPLQSISNARHRTRDENQALRATSHSSARARGMRHSSVGRTPLPPPSCIPRPQRSQHDTKMPPHRAKLAQITPPSLPKQSRNRGVNHSFDLQFEDVFFSQGFKEISC